MIWHRSSIVRKIRPTTSVTGSALRTRPLCVIGRQPEGLRHALIQLGTCQRRRGRAASWSCPYRVMAPFTSPRRAKGRSRRSPGATCLGAVEPGYVGWPDNRSLPDVRRERTDVFFSIAATLAHNRQVGNLACYKRACLRPAVTLGAPESSGDRNAGIAMSRTPRRRQRCRGSEQM